MHWPVAGCGGSIIFLCGIDFIFLFFQKLCPVVGGWLEGSLSVGPVSDIALTSEKPLGGSTLK